MEKINLPEKILKEAGKDDTFIEDKTEHLNKNGTKLSELNTESEKTISSVNVKIEEMGNKLEEVKTLLSENIQKYESILSIYNSTVTVLKTLIFGKNKASGALESMLLDIQNDIKVLQNQKEKLENKIYLLSLGIDSVNSSKN